MSKEATLATEVTQFLADTASAAEAAAIGGAVDAETLESLDKRRAALEVSAKAAVEAAKESDKDEQAERNEALNKKVHDSSNKENLNKAKQEARSVMHDIYSKFEKGENFAITPLPSVTVADPNVNVGDMLPMVNAYSGSAPGGAFGPESYADHTFIRSEIHVNPSALLSLDSPAKVIYSYDIDGKGTPATNQSYASVAGSVDAIINATGTGAAGAGNIPEGTHYVPVPEMLRFSNTAMLDPQFVDLRVTPGDLNPMKILQITVESGATNPAAEDKTAVNAAPEIADTNPTTAEVTLTPVKVATNMSITREATMKNYIVGVEEVFGEQGYHQHLLEVNDGLTSGTGSGGQMTGIQTAIDGISNVPTHSVPAAATIGALGIDGTTYLAIKSLLKPGLRGSNMVYMFPDAIHHRAIIAQYASAAPGFSALFSMEGADDARSVLGRIWGGWLVSNEDVTSDTTAANRTIGLYYNRDSYCVRTLGTTMSFNFSIYENRDRIGVFLRTYANGLFKWPQVTNNFSAGRLRTSA